MSKRPAADAPRPRRQPGSRRQTSPDQASTVGAVDVAPASIEGEGPPVASVAPALVAWFDHHARDLPWRHDRTGYRVWVSEVMLQQTRVSTVIPYYDRFLTAFPTLGELAAADIARVLSLWSGLGYYRRARGLHEGARDVAARFGGELPATVEGLRSIKGIGPYTAGAIASLAFGVRAPIVDGNVIRVLSRLYAITDDARQARVQKQIWALAEALLPAERPGAFNEAMMELGATVCLPRDPLCLVCPLSSMCAARRRGIERSLPLLAPPKAPTLVHAAALVARRPGEVLLGRRRPDALFGGLWEPPTVEAPTAAEAAADLTSFARDATSAGTVSHTLSHRKMQVNVYAGNPASAPAYPPVYDEIQWVQEARLAEYGISTLARKLLKKAEGG